MLKEINVPGLKIAYVYDIGRKTQQLEDVITLVENKQYRPEVASVSWGRVADMPPLQAADMIATESFWAVQKWIESGDHKNASAHFKRLMEEMAGDGIILDREGIQAEIDRRGSDGKLR